MITIQIDCQVLSIYFLQSINEEHQYATRLASKKCYYLPKAKTNYQWQI